MSTTEIEITLRLTLDNEVSPTHSPEEWDWYQMIDLGPAERVEVMSVLTLDSLG